MSVDALHEIVAPVAVIPEADKPDGMLGGVVSGGGLVVTDNELDCAELFPAASNADTV